MANEMQTVKLTKLKKPRKRVGRGYGSGRGGHTAGRGTKGQKSRSKIGVLFEGMKTKKSLTRRLPFLRGKGRLKPRSKPVTIKLGDLNALPARSKVNIDTLDKSGLVNRSESARCGVKIVSGGELTKNLTIELPISRFASDEVVKQGGKVNQQSQGETLSGKLESRV